MYLMHNSEKYDFKLKPNEYPTANISIDEYSEIYIVLNVEKITELYGQVMINERLCCIKTAYYYSIINKITKIIDDEIFVPIKRFIRGDYYYVPSGKDNNVDISFWNQPWCDPPKDIQKITIYVQMDNKYINSMDLFHDNAKLYTFSKVTFLIIESSESDLDNLQQKAVSCKVSEQVYVHIFRYIQKN